MEKLYGEKLRKCSALAGVAQLAGALSSTPKAWRFDSWSGHIPGVASWALVGERMGGH